MAADWQQRGVKLTVAYQAEPKALHGRRERREMWVLSDPELAGYVGSAGEVGQPWPHLQQLYWVRRERTVKGVTTVETGYGITSVGRRKGGARRFLRLNREYWGIENGLHWVLDVVFREDASRVREGHAGANLALLRRVAVSLLKRAPGKRTTPTKRLKAGWDDDYLLLVLQGITAEVVR